MSSCPASGCWEVLGRAEEEWDIYWRHFGGGREDNNNTDNVFEMFKFVPSGGQF